MAEAARFLSTWGMTVTQLIAAPASAQPVPRKGLSRTALVVVVVWTVAVMAIGLVVGVMATRGR